MVKQILKSRIRFLRSAEAGKLAHRPELAPIPSWMNAACVRKLPRKGNIAREIDRLHITGSVKSIDFFQRDCLKTRSSFLMLFESRPKCLLLPTIHLGFDYRGAFLRFRHLTLCLVDFRGEFDIS